MRVKRLMFIFSLSALLLGLAVGFMYNPDVTPEKQDYIFNMKVISEFLIAFSFLLSTYARRVDSITLYIRWIVRCLVFATGFQMIREIFGWVNTFVSPHETPIFILMLIGVSWFSNYKIQEWEKLKKIKR